MPFQRLGGALSFCIVLSLTSSLLVQASEHAPRVAVVDVGRVFDAYARVADVKAQVMKQFEPVQTGLKQVERDLRDREIKLRNDPREKKDPTLFKEVQKFEADHFDFELKLADVQKRFAEREAAEMKSVLDDIKSAIAAVARAEHFDLVLRCPDDDTPPTSAEHPRIETMQEMVARFRRNPILTYNPDLDITANIITTLNDEYKKAGK